ncbi:MAG: HAD family phosphatase [Pseudomonadota bacterium]
MTSSHTPKDRVHDLLRDIDLVIFDFDGVVADSEVISLSTLHRALDDFGIYMPLSAVRETFLGTSMTTILKHVESLKPSCSTKQFADHWQAMLFEQLTRHLTPVPGVVALLNRLQATRTPYCIGSSSSFKRLGVALDAMTLRDRFAHVFSAEQVNRGKPAPDLFLHAAQQLGTDPTSCLVIEDSPFGVRAAKAAGMRCAGFVGGAHMAGIRDDHAATLKCAGADLILDSFAALASKPLARGQALGNSVPDEIEERPTR